MTRKIIKWSLLVATVLFLVSGFGITHFRVVETVTFGLLTKPLAFKIHEYLWIPFLVLLIGHIFYNPLERLLCSDRKSDK